MRRQFLLRFAAYLGVSAVLLCFSPAARASSCSPTTLDNFLSPSFTCTEVVGGVTLTFGGFIYTENSLGGAATISPSGISVAPLANGFEFSPAYSPFGGGLWSITNDQEMDLDISFTITAPAADITDFSVAMLGSSLSGPGSLVQVSQIGNNGAAVSDCTYDSPDLCVTLTSDTFSGVASLTVYDHITLSGSSLGPVSASIGGAQVTFSTTPTPEPSSLLLIGTGLLGLAGALRRKLFA